MINILYYFVLLIYNNLTDFIILRGNSETRKYTNVSNKIIKF